MSQSNRVGLFFFLFFFLPMISRDHNLVFFSAISMKHVLLVQFVKKIDRSILYFNIR
jgi:hypothetical protein